MKKFISEMIGTFALVFCGTGAIIINQETGVITHPGVAITFGLIVMTMIYALGDISGAHLNPAVTIAFSIAGRLRWKESYMYIGAQLSGALVASIILRFLFPANEFLGSTLPAGSQMQSFVLEGILSFLLMFVILNVSVGPKERGITAGIAIGAVVGLEAMFAGPISGASMNPARSFAPAIISGHLESVWVYLLAPFVGMILSVLCFNVLQKPE